MVAEVARLTAPSPADDSVASSIGGSASTASRSDGGRYRGTVAASAPASTNGGGVEAMSNGAQQRKGAGKHHHPRVVECHDVTELAGRGVNGRA